MDYEKLHKDTIAKLQEMVNSGKITAKVARGICADFVPENEDERTKNEIIAFVEQSIHRGGGTPIPEEKEAKWIAWLEKQGEQKPFDYENENVQQNNFAPKVEPEFREGEWLCENEPNNYARFIQILEIVNVQGKDRYRISRDLHNDEDIVDYGFIEYNYHSFNIKDAEAGDVLKEGSCTFIIQKLGDNGTTAKTYCTLHDDGDFDGSSILYFDVNDTKPATKEQRDLLFQKMHEAGYEWDAEKKELKKIEQNPIWSEGDELMLVSIIQTLKLTNGAAQLKIDWLNSLKDRYTWKPSEEQMRVLVWCMPLFADPKSKGILESLIGDLKKLM